MHSNVSKQACDKGEQRCKESLVAHVKPHHIYEACATRYAQGAISLHSRIACCTGVCAGSLASLSGHVSASMPHAKEDSTFMILMRVEHALR